MKTEKLLHSIGMIDDKFIEEAAPKENVVALPKFTKNSIRVWRFTSVAACMIIAVTAMLFFGRNGLLPTPPNELLPTAPRKNNPPHSQTEQSNNPGGQIADNHPMIYPLTLNEADAGVLADIHIPGHFWHELTDEQLDAVFPDFQLTITATAHYRGDGSLFNIMAYEAPARQDNEDIAKFNEHYTLTQIQIAPGEIAEDVVYEYKAKASEVYGVPVVAGVFYGNENDDVALYIASFKLEGISYYIKLHDSDKGESGLNRLTEIVNSLIRGGKADLSVLNDPVIPELRNDQLTLNEARSDLDFGSYLPKDIPSDFQLESAHRFINQETNSLSVHWRAGYDYIDWSVSTPSDSDRERIVSVNDREKYDMSLYIIPLADSVPEELREYVDHPVFLADELTPDLVRARAYQIDDRGDTPEPRMRFSVLYGDVIVSVNIKGASPEDVWNMLKTKT